MTRYIFITGGVASSLGKGIASAGLGALLQARGYSVKLRKLDPYLNVDPGTMSPFQHGEVFVTEDGTETDLDLGHYERFTDVNSSVEDNITTGQIYNKVIERERRGDYLGGTVQIIPHVTDQIKEFILNNNKNIDFCLCEIGGTVGDIEGLPFFEAIRQLGNELSDNKTCFVHLTLVPYIAAAGEIKTKPTQHSVKELRSIGIQPDVLLCRSEKRIDKSDIKKIAIFCNVSEKSVIQATDVKTIYEIPKIYMQNGFDTEVLASMNIKKPRKINLRKWNKVVHSVNNPKGQVNIGVIGKYVGLKDAYKSLSEALTHGGIANDISVKIHWIDSEKIKTKKDTKLLKSMSGILIPGGFGKRGSEGKILAINYARTNKIPFFGICFGMQLAVIEAARNLAKIDNANSSELSNTKNPVIGLMTEWEKNDKKFLRDSNSEYGGTMRLGSYPAVLNKKSFSYKIYKTKKINERHRHRYEVNINYKEKLEQIGLNFSGISPDGLLPEIVEIKNHPWFIGVQFHPELKSRPFDPHPLFSSFIKASIKESKNKK
ncbi:MAG: CTP synthase [Pseudomonadota bacterium]|nr:CTP synthase [Pseudomonadota bacterium]MEC8020320.1 CTP synthase [Pseudomonadota bacterium]MEC8797361.1 CTP synthase [Pseudomonadota bacterium]|tara:strand:+ start:2538 stop:4169 length:1632 start_codon:yes stop_codon:yes gene_type:complete